MKRLLPLLLGLSVGLLVGFAPGRADGPYEYRFVRLTEPVAARQAWDAGRQGEQTANALAAEGWELDQIDALWLAAPNQQSEGLILVFKRPRR